jgi:poly(hydroxyalkanoate) granule-associated protein
MVTKMKKASTAKKPEVPLSSSVKDSAQLIWQAGLGAFNKAQAEGTKAFEALVKEGVNFQRKTQSAAEEKLTEASSKISDMASGISSKATGQWDKLETIFEDRVAKALNKLGVPSSQDIDALIHRIDELNKSVQKLSNKAAPSPATAKKTTKTTKPATKPATKSAAKPAAPRKRAKAKSVETPT